MDVISSPTESRGVGVGVGDGMGVGVTVGVAVAVGSGATSGGGENLADAVARGAATVGVLAGDDESIS